MSERKIIRDSIVGIRRPSIKRLAYRAGTARLSGMCYEEIRNVMQAYMENTIRDAITYTTLRRAKTINQDDMLSAIQQNSGTSLVYSKKIRHEKA